MLPDPRPYFADLSDPRRETRNKLHPLSDILMIVFCAVLSGVDEGVGMGYDNDSFIFGPQGRASTPCVAWKSCRNANLGYSGVASPSVIPMMERGDICATKLNSRCQLGTLIS